MSRIIAGSAKGRRLATPKGPLTRPTTDRTREALFSALASWFGSAEEEPHRQLAGVSVLDLYAGSGAVGLEAASRGAAPITLVEADRATAKIIEKNAADLGFRCSVRAAKVEAALAIMTETFDFVFLDPPYGQPTEAIEEVLERLSASLLAPRALVVVERSSRDRPPTWPTVFVDSWQRDYGETTLYYSAVS